MRSRPIKGDVAHHLATHPLRVLQRARRRPPLLPRRVLLPHPPPRWAPSGLRCWLTARTPRRCGDGPMWAQLHARPTPALQRGQGTGWTLKPCVGANPTCR